jgi:hypothetical protein
VRFADHEVAEGDLCGFGDEGAFALKPPLHADRVLPLLRAGTISLLLLQY